MSPPLKEYMHYAEYIDQLVDPKNLVVGVTGHRDLLPEDKETVKVLLKEKLTSLREANRGRTLVLLSALAPGADQWVAECLEKSKKDRLLVLETMKDADALTDTFKNYETYSAFYLDPQFCHERIQLYYDYEGDLTTAQRQAQYGRLGQFMVENCDHLLALWDGVDGGGLGGTSDVVRMWIKGKGLDGKSVACKSGAQTLHQLVLPRQQNQFPLGRRFDPAQAHLPVGEKYSWALTAKPAAAKTKLTEKIIAWASQRLSWVVVGILLFGLLLTVDLATGFQWADVVTLLVLMAFYVAAAWAYYGFRSAHSLLLGFVYPIMIAFAVLMLGTLGFRERQPSLATGDAFFSAANLITLNSSVLNVDNKPEIKASVLLEIARILGGFFAGYAFVLAFSLAVGKEGISRIRFWWFRVWREIKWVDFTVVIGDGYMALDTVLDLEEAGKRVVLLDEGRNPKVEEILKNRRVWYMKGNLTSQTALDKTYFQQAAAVYVLGDSDEENFRITQEMDDSPLTDKNWYVHLSDLRLRELLHRVVRKDEESQIRTFYVHENTARRLLTRYPVDRFDQPSTKGARVILLGFGALAREIALTCIRLGIYTDVRYLTVKVYYQADEEDQVDQFQAQHPELFGEGGCFGQGRFAEPVRDYTFSRALPPKEVPIGFERLPSALSDLQSPEFSLYQLIEPSHSVSLYACLDSGIESAKVLAALLPRIQWLKLARPNSVNDQTDVQTFCYYNFPDLDEEEYLETRLNALAPYVPVICFGNFLRECSVAAIRNEEMNQIARRLALLYACLYQDEVVADLINEIRSAPENSQKLPENAILDYLYDDKRVALVEGWTQKVWRYISEDERESNIQAADHAWVKFRQMRKNFVKIGTPADFWNKAELATLGELEHRRWNAEKLTLGWLPFADNAQWNTYKKPLKDQYYHYHLVSFDDLPPQEKEKDYTQVKGLPYFFKDLMKNGSKTL